MGTQSKAKAGDGKEESKGTTDATFTQLSALLRENALIEQPLDIEGLSPKQLKQFGNVLHALLAQKGRDADVRQELATRARVLESTVERTKKFWQEDEEKRIELERRSEAFKSAVASSERDTEAANAQLRQARDELQKTRRDLLVVKQQAAQQKQVNERHVERLRARFTEEAIKSLRTNAPQVFVASTSNAHHGKKHAASNHVYHIQQSQIDELEKQRHTLVSYNAALKRFATEALNLTQQANGYLKELVREGQDDSSRSGSNATSSLFTSPVSQNEVFPPGRVLEASYSSSSSAHPAIEVLAKVNASINEQIQHLRKGHSVRSWKRTQEAKKRLRQRILNEDAAVDDGADETIEAKEADTDSVQSMQRLLDDALDQIDMLDHQLQKKSDQVDTLQQRTIEDAPKDDVEVERLRSRYLSLCRALEEQELSLRHEREQLAREREQMVLEHSLSVHDGNSHADTSGLSSSSYVQQRDNETNDESQLSNMTIRSVKRTPLAERPTSLASTPLAHAVLSSSSGAHLNRGVGVASRIPSATLKRPLGYDGRASDDQENNLGHADAGKGKRAKVANGEPTGTKVVKANEMRFITMRKQRPLPR